MKSLPCYLIFFFFGLGSFSFAFDHSHALWQQTLDGYVDKNGNVDYAGLKKPEAVFPSYIVGLRAITGSEINSWKPTEAKAFWINAYNALTIELILKNYPVKSIKDIKNPWSQPVLTIDKKAYSLDDIEHRILRKEYFDARLHAALICASGGCPALGKTAFTGDNVEEELTRRARAWVNDPLRNQIIIRKGTINISEIFNWYKEDFEKVGGVKNFISTYSDQSKLDPNQKIKIRFLEYDWSLNDQHGKP